MFKPAIRTLVLALASAAGTLRAADGVVVIGHPNVQQLDPQTLEKIYTGKLIQVGGVYVTAVNADAGSAIRDRFLQAFLKKDEGKYTGYWLVRRNIGQGKPPRELTRSIDIINFVNSTPGAIGYISEADVQPGMNVLLR